MYDILITREPSSDDNEYDEEMDYGGSQTMHSKDLGTHWNLGLNVSKQMITTETNGSDENRDMNFTLC